MNFTHECTTVVENILTLQYKGKQRPANSPSPSPSPEPRAPSQPRAPSGHLFLGPLLGTLLSANATIARNPCPTQHVSRENVALIFSMGRKPQNSQSEEILDSFNEEILTIVNRKKFLIFPMRRNPRYFQCEEILHIFNRKRGATHPKHTSHASFASPRYFSLHSHELLVFI